MSKIKTPIPAHVINELLGTLLSTYDDDDLPDVAWFQMLEDDCASFMKRHKLKGCSNDATHQMLEILGRNPS
jgi:hypothetical protein